MTKVKIDNDNWIRCGKCSHKLGQVVGAGECKLAPIIEIKCHSCKELNIWQYDYWRVEMPYNK